MSDLNHVLTHTASLWEELRGKRIFITGGTGFFGCWLLESFAWANRHLKLNAKALVLTRDSAKFAKKRPHLFNDAALSFHQGDIKNFTFPEGEFSHVIHAATEASVTLNERYPLIMLDTIIQGTQRVLEFTRQCKAKKILLASSGAVYGKQPPEILHLSEEHECHQIPNNLKAAYAIGKCTAEHMSCLYGAEYGIEIKIARCFAFVGPYLPLDTHFAIGNFIQNGLNGEKIIVKGDGTAYRSYLYAADLAIWLWTILFCGQTARPYNVGSDQAYSIAEIAELVANAFESPPEIQILQKPLGRQPERYIPEIRRVETELKLTPTFALADAIQSTIRWNLLKTI